MRSNEHKELQQNSSKNGVRINKFLADCGITSRRKAEDLISKGFVKINDKTIKNLGTIVGPSDIVTYKGEKISKKSPVHILINKPKNCLTTNHDPENRKIVLDLIDQKTKKANGKIFAVGRLDRNTSGVLLLTNNGDLANSLMHPKKNVQKVYAVKLDQKVPKATLEEIANGINVEDDWIKPDYIEYQDQTSKDRLYLTIHSGQNRIVRRLFKTLGYDVENLDRIVYAGLTKEGLKPGQWRYLSEKEVKYLENQVNKKQ